MVRSTTSDVRIVAHLQQTVLEAKRSSGTVSVPAGSTVKSGLRLDLIPATMIRHCLIAAEMPDTGNSASYAAIVFFDGTRTVTLKKVTGAAPSVVWDGAPIIDTGFSYMGHLCAYISVEFYNAGTATVTAKYVYQFEKLA